MISSVGKTNNTPCLKSIYRIFQKQLGNIVNLKSSLPITLQKAIFELQVGILLKYPYDVSSINFQNKKHGWECKIFMRQLIKLWRNKFTISVITDAVLVKKFDIICKLHYRQAWKLKKQTWEFTPIVANVSKNK